MLRLWPNNKILLTVTTTTTTTTITNTCNYYYYYYYYYYYFVALSPVIINDNKHFQKMIMKLCLATPRGNLSSKPGVPRLGPTRLRGAAFS